jgi:hypothetical protein
MTKSALEPVTVEATDYFRIMREFSDDGRAGDQVTVD